MNVLTAGVGFETVGAQAPTALGDQGLPTYGASTNIQARVVREVKVARTGEGSEIATMATLWVDAAQAVLPVEEWRLTLSDGLVGIVVERNEGRSLAGALDHIRLRLRRE